MKLIGRGTWAGGWHKRRHPAGGEVEVYDGGRYFTVTGRPVGAYPVADITARLAAAFPDPPAAPPPPAGPPPNPPPASPAGGTDPDDDIVRRAGAARNGAKFRALWAGDTAGAGGDDSAADLALCAILAYWAAGDPAAVDRLFRRSGLMRPKWDDRRGDTTYGAMTVAKAVASQPGHGLGGGRPAPPSPTDGPADRPWPDPIDPAAFVGPLGDYVRLVEADTEADPVAVLLQLLVLFGNVIGRGAFVPVGAVQHHTNEFLVIVGETSGGRKGTSFADARAAFAGVDDAWLDGRVLSGLSSGEGLIHAVRDTTEEQQPIKEKGRTVGYETVVTDPGVEDKRLVAVESEFVGVLKQAERQGNILSVVCRQAWESGRLRTLTKHSPTQATGAHVSVVGHITGAELKKYLGEVETANGFGNRFLWAVSRRSRHLPEPPRPDPGKTAAVRARILAAVAFARTAGAVDRDAAAKAAWAAAYPELERDRPGLSGALTARAAPHVLRLSLVYALSECSPAVRPRHMEAALAVWEYCERSVSHLFGDATGDGVADDALGLIRRCPDGVTRSDLMGYFGRNIPSARLSAALGVLLTLGQVRRAERADTGGRPAEVWFPAGGGR